MIRFSPIETLHCIELSFCLFATLYGSFSLALSWYGGNAFFVPVRCFFANKKYLFLYLFLWLFWNYFVSLFVDIIIVDMVLKTYFLLLIETISFFFLLYLLY